MILHSAIKWPWVAREQKVINEKTASLLFKNDDDLYIQPGALLIFKLNNKVIHALALMPPLSS